MDRTFEEKVITIQKRTNHLDFLVFASETESGYVSQASPKLTNPPASGSRVLG